MGKVPLEQTHQQARDDGQDGPAEVEQVEPGGTPLPLQHGSDPVVEIAAQQQVEGVVAVGHHQPRHQPPQLALKDVQRDKFQHGQPAGLEHEAAQQVDEVHADLGEDDDLHQVGDAEAGMLGTEAVDGTAAFLIVQGKTPP